MENPLVMTRLGAQTVNGQAALAKAETVAVCADLQIGGNRGNAEAHAEGQGCGLPGGGEAVLRNGARDGRAS